MSLLSHSPATQGSLRPMARAIGRRPEARAALALLMAASLGLQWMLLQGLAWSLMMARFSAQENLGAALIKTLDGDHPCPLCMAAQRGSQQQQEDEDGNPPAAKSKAGKQEAAVACDSLRETLQCMGWVTGWREPLDGQRRGPPPHAPPRAANPTQTHRLVAPA